MRASPIWKQPSGTSSHSVNRAIQASFDELLKSSDSMLEEPSVHGQQTMFQKFQRKEFTTPNMGNHLTDKLPEIVPGSVVY